MSLIQEALRRQQMEAEGMAPPDTPEAKPDAPPEAAPPPPPPPPPPPAPVPAPAPPPPAPPKPKPAPAPEPAPVATPPPLPTTPADGPGPTDEGKPAVKGKKKPRASSKEKGALPTLIGILLVIALLVGGAIWIIVFAFQQWKHSSGDTAAASPSVEAAPMVEPSRAQPQPTEPTVAPAPPKIAKPAAPTSPIEPTPSPVLPKEPVVKPTPAPKPAAPQPSEPKPAEPKPLAAVRWPVLTLQGVIGKGLNGSAIINDQVLAVNETIEGVHVLAVDKQSVKLEYEGEQRTLRVGISTQ